MNTELERILIVDDSRVTRSIVRRALTSAGYEDDALSEATDGLDALEKIAEHAPDLVLSDVNMPGFDGYQLLEAIQEMDDTKRPLVLMITSLSGLAAVKKLLHLGAAAVIGKPFAPETLAARIQALSGGRPAALASAGPATQDPVATSVTSALETMAFFEVEEVTPEADAEAELMSAEISFANGHRLAIGLAEDVAQELASRLLAGDEVEGRTLFDAVLELCNVISGRLASIRGWDEAERAMTLPRALTRQTVSTFAAQRAFMLDGDGVVWIRYAPAH